MAIFHFRPAGVLVLQLKPQLERLLRLPEDSLTKEIKLTQCLLSLFIEYQIPSDLLSYDGDAAAPAAEKLEAVKAHAAAILAMIEEAKQEELKGRQQEACYADPFGGGMPSEGAGSPFGSAPMGGFGFGSGAMGGGGGKGGGCFGGAARSRAAARPQQAAIAGAAMPQQQQQQQMMEMMAAAPRAAAIISTICCW